MQKAEDRRLRSSGGRGQNSEFGGRDSQGTVQQSPTFNAEPLNPELRLPTVCLAFTRPLWTRFGLLPLSLGVFLLLGCAGYQVGNWSLYPSHIETVYVPMFQSASFRRFLGERLTEAVVKKIEEKTPYKVVNTPNADSELSGEIVSDTKRVLIENHYDEPRKLEYTLVVRVRWVDRRGQLLRECPPVPLSPEVIGVTGRTELIPEFGQSVASSSQQAIDEAAEQIVSLMEIPW